MIRRVDLLFVMEAKSVDSDVRSLRSGICSILTIFARKGVYGLLGYGWRQSRIGY
jgi:hypothetical protein